MKITLHGAAQEVGRSCVEVSAKDKYLIDCGLKIAKGGNQFPEGVKVKDVKGVFISHAHLDHTGALPLFNARGLNCPIYCTAETKEISKVLLKDSLHIEMLGSEDPNYEEENIWKVLDLMKNVQYRKEQKLNNIKYTFHDAGHIPGSASVKLNIDGKNILYTGDINTSESELLKGADTDYGKVDVMISESTYGDREHPSRDKEENNFLNAAKDTVDKNGVCLVPVFGVGRAQEVILMLSRMDLGVPIYLDGMAKKITDLFLQRPKYLKDKSLKKASEKVNYVKNWKERETIVKEPAIVVSTAGMMSGGPVMAYMKHLSYQENSSVLLTGYQAHGTNGESLLNKRIVNIDNKMYKYKGRVEKYDFSAHAGQKELIALIKKTNPKSLIVNHGELDSEQTLAKEAEKFGIEVFTPKLGEELEF